MTRRPLVEVGSALATRAHESTGRMLETAGRSALRAMLTGVSAACAVCLSACLDRAEEPALYSSYVLPPGTRVPRLEEDMAAGMKLDANDGFPAGLVVPLRTGFADGVPVQYWDLGQLTATTLRPMYIFRLRSDPSSELGRMPQPNLIDGIPGDASYSPLRQLYIVDVTDKYRGERITSARALEDAEDLGLIEAPVPSLNFMNCVVTAPNVSLEGIDDPNEVPVAHEAYYRGTLVTQYCVGGVSTQGVFQIKEGSNQFTNNAYLLRRQNENQLLDEGLQRRDLSGDGDQLDSNTIFDMRPSDEGYTGIWRSVEVSMPREYVFGASTTEEELFDRRGTQLGSKPPVLDYKETGVFLNRPIRW